MLTQTNLCRTAKPALMDIITWRANHHEVLTKVLPERTTTRRSFSRRNQDQVNSFSSGRTMVQASKVEINGNLHMIQENQIMDQNHTITTTTMKANTTIRPRKVITNDLLCVCTEHKKMLMMTPLSHHQMQKRRNHAPCEPYNNIMTTSRQ